MNRAKTECRGTGIRPEHPAVKRSLRMNQFYHRNRLSGSSQVINALKKNNIR